MKEGRKVLDLVSTLLKLINFGLKKHKVSFNSDSNLWNNLFQRKPNRIRILELPLGNISIEILAYFVIFLMLKMERITLLHRTCTYSSVQPNAIWLLFMTSCWGRSFINIISQSHGLSNVTRVGIFCFSQSLGPTRGRVFQAIPELGHSCLSVSISLWFHLVQSSTYNQSVIIILILYLPDIARPGLGWRGRLCRVCSAACWYLCEVWGVRFTWYWQSMISVLIFPSRRQVWGLLAPRVSPHYWPPQWPGSVSPRQPQPPAAPPAPSTTTPAYNTGSAVPLITITMGQLGERWTGGGVISSSHLRLSPSWSLHSLVGSDDQLGIMLMLARLIRSLPLIDWENWFTALQDGSDLMMNSLI